MDRSYLSAAMGGFAVQLPPLFFLSSPALSNDPSAGQGWTEERRCPLACQRNVTASSVQGGAVWRSLQLSITSGAAWDQHGELSSPCHASLFRVHSFIRSHLSCGPVVAVCAHRLDIQTHPQAHVIKHAGKVQYFIMRVSIFWGSNPPSPQPQHQHWGRRIFLLDLSWLERGGREERGRECLHLNCSALRLFNLIMRLHFIVPGCCAPFRLKAGRWSDAWAASRCMPGQRRRQGQHWAIVLFPRTAMSGARGQTMALGWRAKWGRASNRCTEVLEYDWRGNWWKGGLCTEGKKRQD